MRTVLLAALLSACVMNPEPRQRIDATWSIERLEGGAAACPDSWATAVLVASNAAGRTETSFPCDDGGGLSSVLAEDAYTARIEFRDRDNAVVATSLEQPVEIGALTTPFESTVYLDAGFVSAAWSWGANERWCGEGWNPFQVIRLTLTGPTSLTQLFSCHDDRGVSVPLLAGTYAVSVGQGFTGHSLPEIQVTAPNRVTVLPVVTL